MGCEKGAAKMEGEELPPSARKEQKLGGGEGLSGAVVSCQRVAEVREGEWLSRYVESCQKMAEMGGKGRAVTSCLELPESAGNRGEGRDGFGLSWTSGKW